MIFRPFEQFEAMLKHFKSLNCQLIWDSRHFFLIISDQQKLSSRPKWASLNRSKSELVSNRKSAYGQFPLNSIYTVTNERL